MKRAIPVLATTLLLLAACGGTKPDAAAPAASSPSTAAAPEPAFADLTRGDSRSVAKIYAYDAKNKSAVVEPIIFMTGDKFCKTYKIAASDDRCIQEWTTEESRSKITVPVAAKPKFLTWEGGPNGEVCLDDPEEGGTCPMTAKAFAAWAAEADGEMVALTVVDGEITKIAQIYTP